MNKDLRYQRFPVSRTNTRSRTHYWYYWPRRRWCPGGRSVYLLVFLLPVAVTKLSFAAPTDIVAMVDGQPIFMREIDELSTAQLSKIRDELGALLARTVDRLIDERLRSLTVPEPSEELSQLPATPSVADEEVRSYRATPEKDVIGRRSVEGVASESDEQTALLRYYLEQKAREAADAQMRQRLRQGHMIRLSFPRPQELEFPMTQERQIAQVDNTWIRAVEFEQAAAWRLYQLRGEIYRERRRSLESAIENALLGNEARRRSMTTEALLAELSAKESVSETEIQAFTTAEQEAGRPAPTAERAHVYLEFRKAYDRRQRLLKKLRDSSPIEILLKPPPIPRLPVVDTGVVVLGAKKGKRLVVYTNYRCPSCRAAQQEIDTLLAQDKQVRVIFHDFIPGYDPVATEAAYFTRCAAQWGVFPRMRQELLTREPPSFGQHWYKESELPQLVHRLRVKKRLEFLECLGTDVYKAIEHDTANARELGFDAPPAFVAEGIPAVGAPSAERLAQALAQGLQAQLLRKPELADGNLPRKRKRRKGRRARLPKKHQVSTQTSSQQRSKSQLLQKPKPTPQSSVIQKAAPQSKREDLFDLE